MMRAAAFAAAALSLCGLPLPAQQTVALSEQDRLLTERPTTLFTIGRSEGEDWEMLSRVRSVAFDNTDNLYVLDAGSFRVLKFDAAGRYVRQFGKKGSGPGEFTVPASIVVTAKNEIVVNDAQSRTLVVFNSGGTYQRSQSYREAGVTTRLQVDPEGIILTVQTAARENRRTSVLRQLLVPDSKPVQLLSLPVEPMRPFSMSMNGQVINGFRDPIYGVGPRVAALPDGNLAVQHSSDYELKIVDRNGAHLRTLTRPIRARKVTREDQDAWDRRRIADFKVQFPNTPPSRLENVPFAEYMEVISGLRSDPQRRLWIQRRERDGADAGPIDLLTAEGRYVGTLPPQALPLAVSSSGRAAWVDRDDLGVERVTVRKLPENWK